MSNRYYGGVISATRITTDGTNYTGNASGVWNLVQLARTKQSAAWPKGQGIYAPLDPPVSSVTTGDESITVTFSAPSDNGGSPITSYTITATSQDWTNPVSIVDVETAVQPVTLYGVTNGITYNVSVVANNAYGSTVNYTTYKATPPILYAGVTGETYYSSTALILDGSGANNVTQFQDLSPKSQAVTIVGTPVVSTSKKVDGTGSIYFDGTKSYLYYPSPFNTISTTSTQFTIDFWWYPTSVTVNSGVCVLGINSKASGSNILLVGKDYWVSGTNLITGLPITINTWQHIAISSNGTNMYLFINGALVNTTTPPTTALSACVLGIGAEFDSANGGTPGNYAPGWVDNFRVTAGVARYTAAFTPSTSIGGKTTPNSPTDISATVGQGQSIVSFTPPPYNVAAVTSYKVVSIPDQIVATGTSSPITVNGLTNGKTYTFRVIAINANGSSAASDPSDPVQPNPPSAPSAATITNAAFSDQSAIIYFNLPVNFGGSVCSYTVTSSPGNFSVTGLTSPITVTGLTNGASYTFTMIVTNSTGVSEISNTSNIVVPARVPDAPTNVSAVYGYQSATVSFDAPASNGDAISQYTVTSSPGNYTATGSASPITISGLMNGATYTFTVNATNKAGAGANSVASNSIIPGRAPAAPVITDAAFGNQTATITFNLTDNGGITINYYTITCSNGISKQLNGSAITPYVFTGLTNGSSYTFTMTATNDKGISPVSNTSAAVIPATTPSAPTLTGVSVSDATATVSYTNSTNDGGSAITGYIATSNPGGFSTTGTSSPLVVTGLTNGTAYTFTVAAINKAGNSAASNVSGSVTPIGVPGAPTLTGVTYSGGTTASVAFTAPTYTGGTTISSYTLTRNDGATVNGTTSPLVMSNNFTDGVTYTFTVKANNAAGTGPASNTSTAGAPKLPVSTTYSSATSNKVISKSTITTIANANGWDGVSPVYVTITNNTNIYATNNTTAALTFSSDIGNLPAGTVINFYNYGNIGGYKGTKTSINGGLGMQVNAGDIRLYNYGVIAGGGGAGGCGWPGITYTGVSAPAGAYLSSSGWVKGANGTRNNSGGPLVGLKYIYKSDAGWDDYGSGLAGGQSSYEGTCGLTEYCSSGGGGGLGSYGGAPGYGSVNVDGSTYDFSGDAPGAGGDAIAGEYYITYYRFGTVYGYTY